MLAGPTFADTVRKWKIAVSDNRPLSLCYLGKTVSYINVIECLKIRFGGTDMLIEVYVRKVLSLTIDNAIGRDPKMPLLRFMSNLSHI